MLHRSGEQAQPELASLFRACLATLRRRKRAGSYRPPLLPLWRVSDVLARMRRLLSELADEGGAAGATLARFMPLVARAPPRYELRCRAALASTLMAELELAREGEVTLGQNEAWAPVEVRTRPEPPAAIIG